MFGNMTTEGFEEETDVLGGGGHSFTSAIYDSTIKMAYAQKSRSSEAMSLVLIATIDGKEYQEAFWYTNKKGENFYVDKNDNTKKHLLPGFQQVNSLCLLATGKGLLQQNHEKKAVGIYDFKLKKEVPTEVEVFMDLLTKPITIALSQIEENKQKKNGAGKYVNTAETRKVNEAKKFFHTETKRTLSEVRAHKANPDGDHTAEFYKAWNEKYAGKLVNNVKEVEGNAGAPPADDSSTTEDDGLFD